MHQLGLDQVIDNTAHALREGNIQLAEELIWPALDQKPDIAALWFYAGTICAQKGQNALGLRCLQASYELEPHSAVWANSAACLREMQQIGLTREVLKMGLERAPWDPHIRANLCGSYVQDGNPLPGIEYGREVMNHEEVGPAVKFNMALLSLEAGNLAEGFQLYGAGHHRFREDRKYMPDPPVLTPEVHADLRGQGKRLLVYGEQGLGDELMFATMLPAVMRDYDVVFDHHPRLEWLYNNSAVIFDLANNLGATLYPTRKTKDRTWTEQCDAKVAIGNLAQFYRTTFESFPAPPFYTAPQDLTAEYRERLLKAAAGRKIIGIATRGGLLHTGRLYRTMPPAMLERFFSDESLMFVNLDYEDMTQLCEWTQQKFGDNKLLWFPSINWHWQYEQTAALVAATDAVITVPQTIAHLAGGLNHPTYVMTSSKPDWRMGLTGERWYWYPSDKVRLLRQQGDSWEPALARLSELLQQSSCNSADFGQALACPLRQHEIEIMKGVIGFDQKSRTVPAKSGSMCELGAKANTAGSYKSWFEWLGYRHVSLDINGSHGSVIQDLQQPLDIAELGGPFDVVTNFGTTEHIDEQVPCWMNIHALLSVGGDLISSTPVNWPNHGRWYPTEEWWQEFCDLNGYQVIKSFLTDDSIGRTLLCVHARKVKDIPFVFPTSPMLEMIGGRVGSYETEKLERITRGTGT